MKCKSIYCDRDAIARELCSKHHKRLMKGKDINLKSCLEMTIEERFLSKVIKNNETGCWLWIGATRGRIGQRYGKLEVNGKTYGAHRFSYMLWKGDLVSTNVRNICVCHKCDTPLCVNPDHLFLGTHMDNMIDKSRKGRTNAKITQCKRGHDFDSKNTWISKSGSRHCRKCHALRQADRKKQNKKD